MLDFSLAAKFEKSLSLFDNAKYKDNFIAFDYVNKDAPKRGEVRFGVEGTFNSLNEFILKGISASGLSYIYDSLMQDSDDEISVMYPLIAKEVLYDRKNKFLIFKLDKRAKFHDGHEITVDDIIFTFNSLIKEGHPAYQLIYKDVISVKKISKYLVKFDFANSNNRDLAFSIASMPVLPKHYYKDHKFAKTTLEPPLGSGPYKITKVEPNHMITYERVKNYWAKDLAVNRGRYNFDKISFDYYHDNSVLVEAFKSQKYDFRQENIARNWASAYDILAIKNGEIIKKKIQHSLPAPMQAFIFNLRKDKFGDINLRKAISYVFDFKWLNDHIFYSEYKRTKSFFENSEFSYDNFEIDNGSIDGFNRKNLIKAQKLLEESGYILVDDILYDKNGKKIEVEFLTTNKSFLMVISPFIKNLRRIGIDAKLKFVEENQYKTRINNFDYDIIVGIFAQALIPGNELYAYFHSSQKDIKGSRNLIGLDNKQIDNLLEKIIKVKKKQQLKKLCLRLDKLLLTNYYVVPQWHNNNYRILYKDIFGIPKQHAKYSLAIDSWWIK